MFSPALLITELAKAENENFRAYVYDDKTGVPLRPGIRLEGNATWGIGWNVSAYPLTLDRAKIMCGWQLDDMWGQLERAEPWVSDLDEPRSRALGNMLFNLGTPRLLQFRDMLLALKESRWLDAKDAALDSEWARQRKSRAELIAEVFASGVYP